jgi:hypothetical protein
MPFGSNVPVTVGDGPAVLVGVGVNVLVAVGVLVDVEVGVIVGVTRVGVIVAVKVGVIICASSKSRLFVLSDNIVSNFCCLIVFADEAIVENNNHPPKIKKTRRIIDTLDVGLFNIVHFDCILLIAVYTINEIQDALYKYYNTTDEYTIKTNDVTIRSLMHPNRS